MHGYARQQTVEGSRVAGPAGPPARLGNRPTPVNGCSQRIGDRGAGRNVRLIAIWRWKRHNGAMPSVQIKDVPEHTHAVLRQRAAAAHQSLQEYLRTKLIQEASAPTVEEVLDRAGGRAGDSANQDGDRDPPGGL